MPRLEPPTFISGKEMMCSAGFWASPSPTCQPEKGQTLGRWTYGRGQVARSERFAAAARCSLEENPLVADLSHRAVCCVARFGVMTVGRLKRGMLHCSEHLLCAEEGSPETPLQEGS